MNKKTLEKIELNLYSETLENGLSIYILPKTNGNNIYTTFTTKFGEKDKEFIPIGKKKMTKVENGIAHFLEHKAFETESGEDPFSFFSSHGADANASTTLDKTTYLFSGVSHFYENLNQLLDFVLTPYFTDENVEKEKGIIAEELSMYEDDPMSKIMEKSLYNSFQNDPIRYYIGGTKDSIQTITKEKLYTCFDTFYHPSNMFLTITGNVDPKETIEFIKKNMEKKSFPKQGKIIRKTYEEKDEVYKKSEVIHKNVIIPKVAVNFKINYSQIDYSFYEIRMALTQLFQMKFSITSSFIEKLKREGVIQNNLAFNLTHTDTHFLFTIIGESKNPDLLIKSICEEMKNTEAKEDELERKKKVLISSYIYMSDNIYALNNKITNNIMDYGKVIVDDMTRIKKFSFKIYKDIISKMNFDHIATVILKK